MTPKEFRKHREALGLSRRALAERWGVAASTINAIENDYEGTSRWKPLYADAMRYLLHERKKEAKG